MKWWTAETLRSYLESEIHSLRRENDLRHDASDTAIRKAEASTEQRFTAVNEFRNALTDQTAGFMPRAEALARADGNASRIEHLSARLDKLEGAREGIGRATASFFAIGGLLLTVVTILITLYFKSH